MRQERANIVAVAGAVPSPSTDPAALSMIGQVAPGDFWADATAGYRGPTRFTAAITDARASLKLTMPSTAAFQPLWKTSITNINKLSAVIAVPGLAHNGFSLNTNCKFSHRPFSVRATHTNNHFACAEALV